MKEIYARFNYPEENSTAWDVEHGRDAELKVGKRYLVEAYIRGPFCTDIWIESVQFPLNAKYFDFEDEYGNLVDIIKC